MRRLLLLLLLLAGPAVADQLTLEFVQEGDPNNPRALIVVHASFADRESLKPFLERWGEKSWVLRQYCSVYSYEYDAELGNLDEFEELGADLLSKVTGNNFDDDGEPDKANPYRDTQVDDNRQPEARFVADKTQLIVVGHGVGGMVAREFALQAKEAGYEVTRVGFFGTPLSGWPLTDQIISMMDSLRAQAFGLGATVTEAQIRSLSEGWVELSRLRTDGDQGDFEGMERFGGYARQEEAPPRTAFSNVLYGPGTAVAGQARLESDGVFWKPVVLGALGGASVGQLKATLEIVNLLHKELLEYPDLFTFVTETVLDYELLEGFLASRANIEAYYKGLGEPPHGLYWDERIDIFEDVFSYPKGLYQFMWLFEVPGA